MAYLTMYRADITCRYFSTALCLSPVTVITSTNGFPLHSLLYLPRMSCCARWFVRAL